MSSDTKRIVVLTTDAGVKIGVNPDHVCLVEPRAHGTTLVIASNGELGVGLSRNVKEPFDEVMRSIRGEERPRVHP